MRHGTATAMEDWLKQSGVWNAELKESIDALLFECDCKVAREPSPHPIVSTNLPEPHKQTSVALDIVFLEGIPVMHAVDKCTGYSETSVLRRRLHDVQVAAFAAIWIYRHGLPKKIHADREYFRGAFADFCKDNDINLVEIAAEDHQANGAVERGNRTLRSFFRRLRAEKPKAAVSTILAEATYAKNICKGSKLASSFELQYGQRPRILQEFDVVNSKAVTVDEHVQNVSRTRLNRMVNSKPRSLPEINVGDFVYFWREKRRWLGPARVVKVTDNVVTIVHDERTMTSSLNRVQKTIPPAFQPESEDEPIPELPQIAAPTSHNDSVAPNAQPETSSTTPTAQRPVTRSTTKRALLPWESGEYPPQSPSFPTFASSSPITHAERADAYQREQNNWNDMGAMKTVAISTVPKSANVIGSHVRYIRKPDGKVKARICPWGNHDVDKFDLRTDAPSMLMEIFRLVISIGVEKHWDIGSMDVRAAFLQADGFKRTIFVRPPREQSQPNVYWRLLAPAYGLVDSGRLWYLTSNAALCNEYGLTRSAFEPTLYYDRNDGNSLSLLVVVQVDNYIYTGCEESMKKFEAFLRTAFEIGDIERNSFDIYGASLSRTSDGTAVVDQAHRLSELADIYSISATVASASGDDMASAASLTKYRSSIGRLLFVGRMTHPVLLRIASTMATKTSALKNHHLKDLAAFVRYALKAPPVLTFRRASQPDEKGFHFEVYSDGSMGSKKEAVARSGYIIFRRCNDIVHPIYWNSRRLRRVARSSATAEILSAADATDRALYLARLCKEICYAHSVSQVTDSRGLFELVATNREPQESLNKIDLAAMRAAFDDGAISAVRWIPGYYMAADALTKDNRTAAAFLNRILSDGVYPRHPDEIVRITSKGDVLEQQLV